MNSRIRMSCATAVALAALSARLCAQVGTVTGVVLDRESKLPLSGSNVAIIGTSLGSTTDSQGKFRLERVPAGRRDVLATYVGYTSRRVSVEIPPDGIADLTIELDAAAIPILPILVTATTARERETPASFTTLARTEIVGRYIAQDVPAVLSELPSVVSYSENGNDMGYTHLNLRGFDERRIAVMVNGVPQNDPEDHIVYWIDMPDLLAYTQNVQLVRGAGSDFYGPPAIGGSINFVTTPIAARPSVSVTTAFGFQEFKDLGRVELNTRKFGVAVNSGLIDGRYALSGNLSTTNSAGYRIHSWIDVTSYFVGAARFDDAMTTRLHIYGGPLQDGLAYNGIPKFYNTDPRLRRINYNYFTLNAGGDTVTYSTNRKPQENESFSQPHVELLNEYRLSSAVKLFNTIFFIRGDGYFDYDGDWVWYDPVATKWFRSVVGYDTSFGSTSFNSMLLRGFVGNKQWGWLPRVEVEHANGYVTIGGELRIHRSLHWGSIPFASAYPFGYNPDFHFYEYAGEKDMASLYGHEMYRWNERTTIMADVQLVYNRYGLNGERYIGTSFSVPYVFVNPRLGVNTNVSDQTNCYVSVGITSREPRLSNLYTGEEAYDGARPSFEGTVSNGVTRYDFTKPLARPERLLDLELGASYQSSDVRISGNVFWMEFSDELINSGKLDIFGVPVTGNADKTRHVGIELDGRWNIDGAFDVNGNVTISRNRLVHYVAFDGGTGGFVSLDGNPIAGFPDVLGNVRFTYHADALSVSLLGKYVGPSYTDNLKREQEKLDGYAVLDVDASFRFAMPSSSFSVTVQGKVRNVLNTLYMAGGQGIEFFPAAERNSFISFIFGF